MTAIPTRKWIYRDNNYPEAQEKLANRPGSGIVFKSPAKV